MQRDATRGTPATDAGLTPRSGAKKKPRTQAKTPQNPGPYWSGTPGSNRRPSPWQGADEDVHGDATRVNPGESLAPPCPSGEADVSGDATECRLFTDAGLTLAIE